MLPDVEAAIRADERRRMDSAICWELSCLGCADRMDGLIAERDAGFTDALRSVETALESLPQDPGVQRSLAIVRGMAADRPDSAAERLGGVSGARGEGPPP